MKELVVISGKGGTGKTTVAACFGVLAQGAVLADCDVDAADLHLLLEPEILLQQDFSGGNRAEIRTEACKACGYCQELCRFHAILNEEEKFRIDPVSCEGCGVCHHFCPNHAVDLVPAVNGKWFVSETRVGPMVHARLGIAQENSGKLVTLLRSRAKELAEKRSRNLVIIDGSPGIGCPVIASITGADLVLAVTEPTLSGRHDLQRAIDLAGHFGVPLAVCVNKWDINPEMTADIEKEVRKQGIPLAGRIRYEKTATEAQVHRQTLVEFSQDGAADDLRQLWRTVSGLLS
ncbi:MAG: ATP-binding protein [Syntrophotaleaceae bacterium]